MSMAVNIVRERASFAGMAERWNELVRRATLRNVFYGHEWFKCWMEEIAPGAQLRIVTLEQDGRLVAAAPLQVSTVWRRGLPMRLLEFLQSGITPRSGLLVEHDDLCAPLLDAIDHLGGWNVAEFKSMELQHGTTRRFADLLGRRGAVVVEAGMSSPYEELPGSWREYYESRTTKMRQRFRAAVNRLNKNGRVEVLRLESYADLQQHYDSLLGISAASWKGEEGTDMATMGQTAAFYRAFSRCTDGRGSWIVYLLRFEGRPIAFMYLLRDGGHWVALRSDYDMGSSYYMPGVYLHKEVISDMVTLPAPRIYDLVGWATPFKGGLAHARRQLCDLTFASRRVDGRLLMQGKTMLGRRRPGRYLELAAVVAGTAAPLNEDRDGESDQEG